MWPNKRTIWGLSNSKKDKKSGTSDKTPFNVITMILNLFLNKGYIDQNSHSNKQNCDCVSAPEKRLSSIVCDVLVFNLHFILFPFVALFGQLFRRH